MLPPHLHKSLLSGQFLPCSFPGRARLTAVFILPRSFSATKVHAFQPERPPKEKVAAAQRSGRRQPGPNMPTDARTLVAP